MSEKRLAKIPGWYVKELMKNKAEAEEWVLWCEVKDGKCWRKLIDEADIDEHFEDWVEVMDFGERMANFNLMFSQNFRFNKVTPNFSGVNTMQLDPMFHAVMSNGYATLHELRTVYSLEDVFLMVDSITTTKRNEQIAIQEARQSNGR